MRKYRGQAIPEYVIIIALIAVSLIAVFTILGGDIKALFTGQGEKFNTLDSSNKQKISELEAYKKSQISVNNSINNTDSSAITKTGETNNTTLNLDSILLNNFPDDMVSYLNATGSSGVTDKLSDALMQIANQINTQGDTVNAEKIKLLANKGHNIARVEEVFNKYVKACNNDINCLNSLTDKPFPVEELNGFIVDEKNNMTKDTDLTDFRNTAFALTSSRFNVDNNSEMDEVGASFLKTLDEVLNSNTIDANTKGVINKLAYDISRMSETVGENMLIVTNNTDTYQSPPRYDLITGDEVPIDYTIPLDEAVKRILNPEAPFLTDYKSKLICYQGYYKDTGKKCE